MRRKDILCWGAALGCTGLLAATAAAYTYFYVGGSVGAWCGYERWERFGCTEGCEECPDDTGDHATFNGNGAIVESDVEIDDLTINNGWVQFGDNFSNCFNCLEFYQMEFDSITISAASGQTAKLQGGACTGVSTN